MIRSPKSHQPETVSVVVQTVIWVNVRGLIIMGYMYRDVLSIIGTSRLHSLICVICILRPKKSTIYNAVELGHNILAWKLTHNVALYPLFMLASHPLSSSQSSPPAITCICAQLYAGLCTTSNLHTASSSFSIPINTSFAINYVHASECTLLHSRRPYEPDRAKRGINNSARTHARLTPPL